MPLRNSQFPYRTIILCVAHKEQWRSHNRLQHNAGFCDRNVPCNQSLESGQARKGDANKRGQAGDGSMVPWKTLGKL